MCRMDWKIVADSSADTLDLPDVSFENVPLHILAGEREFVDDANLDVNELNKYMAEYKGTSSTSCPSVGDWLNAFGDAKFVLAFTITSGLSGSYSAAQAAREQYLEEHPERQVFLVDSLSTGPEIGLLIEKAQELIVQDLEPQELYDALQAYQTHTRLIFSLDSVYNLANNGRVNSLVAKAIGALGIRLFGTASGEGTLEILKKCKGFKCACRSMLDYMEAQGYRKGRIRIAHNGNLEGAEKLGNLIRERFGNVEISIYATRGLCSYYAEKGSILLGMEC